MKIYKKKHLSMSAIETHSEKIVKRSGYFYTLPQEPNTLFYFFPDISELEKIELYLDSIENGGSSADAFKKLLLSKYKIDYRDYIKDEKYIGGKNLL